MKKQLFFAMLAVCSLGQLFGEDTYSVRVVPEGLMGLALNDLVFTPYKDKASSIDRNGDPTRGTQSLASECYQQGTRCYLYKNSPEAIEEARKTGEKIGRFAIEDFNKKKSKYIGTAKSKNSKYGVYVQPEVMALEQPVEEGEVTTMPIRANRKTLPK